MARPFFALLSLSLLLVTAACTKRTICPAFQSAFIYDKNELRKKFSYFQEDSTPKVFTASKTKYLIAEPTTYRKKMRSLQTIEMKDIHPTLPDSMKLQDEGGLVGEDGVVPGAELDMAARSVIDSTYIVDVPQDTTAAAEGDSTYMISKDKELRLLKFVFPDSAVYDESTGKYVPKPARYEVADIRFNVEQDNYMWYLRNSLVLPDVRLAQMMQGGDDGSEGKKAKEKKGIGRFFKNLFNKKKKSASDSLDTGPVKPAEDFDYVDDNEGATPAVDAAQQTKQKKGPFSFLKKKEKTPAATSGGGSPKKKEKKKKAKKEKKPKAPEEPKPDEPKKEEDDGF